ncbi:MAG: FAD-dependent oxidoreductase [Terriglobales bacterium]
MSDIAIIGAGPYGLSAAAHLRTVPGLKVRIFGEPMAFWRSMPRGMLLRSNWPATHIAAPAARARELGLDSFAAEQGPVPYPVPLEGFTRFGEWFQQRAVPDLDRRQVAQVEAMDHGFRLRLGDGEAVEAERVIVAAGIRGFERRPAFFAALPPELVSHTADHADLGRFAGRRVLIVGGGQSALESAALLHEAGAEPEVVARATCIHWLQGRASKLLHHQLGSWVPKLLYAPTDVGPAGLSQLLARPRLFNTLPREVRDRLRRRAVRPAGARWLVERLQPVPIQLGYQVTSVAERGGRVHARLSDGTERHVDHLLLGTGYQVDIARYAFLAPDLLRRIAQVKGYPVLGPGLETSVPGLHILGAPAAREVGPILQFVSGTRFAGPALVSFLAPRYGARLARQWQCA